MTMHKDYFNTNDETGEVLKKSRFKASSQQVKILEYMSRYFNELSTPWDIQMHVLPDTPITSVRRALTNLTDAGLIFKTDYKKTGKYGKINHTWIYKGDRV